MDNNCYFEVKLVGKEEEVKEVAGYFSEHYDYTFFDFKEFFEKRRILLKI